MFRVTIGNEVLTDEPDLTEFTTQIVRDEDVKGLFIKYPESIKLGGRGYEIIRDLLDAGYFNETTIKIEKSCTEGFTTILSGIIFVRTAVLNRNRCEVEIDIQEDTFSSRIFNNLDQKVNIGSSESKNGVDITPAPLLGGLELWSVDCGPTPCVATFETFAGAAGFAHNGTRRHIDMMDALKYLVRWMTDGEGTVQSDWYDSLPAGQRASIIEGKELRLGQDAPNTYPEVSFRQIYNDFLQRTDNLFMTIEGREGNRVLRIEDRPFFEEGASIITLDYVADIQESIKQTELWSYVKFGSSSVYEGQLPNFPILAFQGHQEEQFTINGTSDIGNALELELGFITDSNLILDVLVNDVSGFDNDIFAVQYNHTTSPHRAHLDTPLFDLKETPVYNPRWFNSEIIKNYNFQGSIVKYQEEGNSNRFSAKSGANIFQNLPVGITNEQIGFANDFIPPFFDTNNNYGNGTPQGNAVAVADSRYTAPISGLYTFTSTVRFTREGIVGPSIGDDVTVQIVRFQSGGGALNSASDSTGVIWNYGADDLQVTEHGLSVEFTTYMDAGDYTEVRAIMEVTASLNAPTISFIDGLFECVAVENGGGVFFPESPNSAFVRELEFTSYINDEDLVRLITDPVKTIRVNTDGSTNSIAIIDNITVNHATQEAEWALVTNKNKIQL